MQEGGKQEGGKNEISDWDFKVKHFCLHQDSIPWPSHPSLEAFFSRVNEYHLALVPGRAGTGLGPSP